MDFQDKNVPIVIPYASGGRRGKVSKKLNAAEFKKIYDYADGFSGKSKGLKVDK